MEIRGAVLYQMDRCKKKRRDKGADEIKKSISDSVNIFINEYKTVDKIHTEN